MLILVKHARPVLDAGVAPKHWRLGPEGEAQARALADSLRQFLPFHLASSPEPKAKRTAEIVGTALGVPVHVVDGLEEFDRPAMPIVSVDEHQRINAEIFRNPLLPVLGAESADAALRRFTDAVQKAAQATPPGHHVVVIAHGTVIALYVAQQRGDDAFAVWQSLDCGTYVVV